MNWTSALVLLAVIWFMVFFVALPIRVTTQGDAGKVLRGTHSAAPEHHGLLQKVKWTTIASLLIWALAALVITQGWITVRDIDWAGQRLPPPVDGRGE